MKKKLFKTFLLSTSILTFGSAIIPSSAVFANEQSTVNTSVGSTLPLSVDTYSTTTYDSATNTTTVTITDQQLVEFMQDQGVEVPQELLNSRSEEHTSELQSRFDLVCRLLLEKKKNKHNI